LNNYRNNKKNFPELAYLSKMARRLNKIELSDSITNDYVNNYLLASQNKKSLNKEDIRFIASVVHDTKGKGFNFFRTYPDTINSVMQTKNYAEGVMDYAISREEIDSALSLAMKGGPIPHWNKISQRIAVKYGKDYAERNILNGQINWYRYKKDWPAYTKTLVIRVENYGAFGFGSPFFDLNNHAWDIFLHSNNKPALRKALIWSDSSIILNPQYGNSYDTKANILHKLGRTKEAILMEKKAIVLDPEWKEYKEVLEKMQHGQPTWSEL
jgi:tetratricopeptide (TPR) repeat protein